MFESTVIRRHMEHRRTHLLSLPLTFVMYAAAAVSVMVALVWSVELPAKPPDQLTIWRGLAELPEMPPPPEGKDQPAEQTTAASEPEMAAETEVPTAIVEEPPVTLDSIPDEVPAEVPANSGDVATDASLADTDNAVGSGGPGLGVHGSVAGGDDQVYPAGLATSQPEVIRSVTPDYPPIALRIRKKGWVVLSCTISKKGLPTDVTVLRSSDPMFEGPAAKALRQYVFKPGEIEGRAVRTRFNLTVNFTLTR